MFGDSKNLSFFNSYNGWSYNEQYLGVIGFLEKNLKGLMYGKGKS